MGNCINIKILTENEMYQPLKLQLNGNVRIEYDKTELSLFCKKITDNCFYIPLTPNNDFSSSNFQYALNLSRMSSIILQINAPVFEGSISIFSLNILRIMSGMVGLLLDLTTNTTNAINIIKWILKNKVLEGDNNCPVNLDIIKLNDKYLNCKTCHKNFLLDITHKYIDIKKICPHCKQQWKEFITYVSILHLVPSST